MTTPPTTFAEALTFMRTSIAALPPASQIDLLNGLGWLEMFAKSEADDAIKAYASKVPIFGGMISDAVTESLNKALDEGLADLKAP